MEKIVGIKDQPYYVARGNDGGLYLFDGKPKGLKASDDYSLGYNFYGINGIKLPGDLYPDLKFGDPPREVWLVLGMKS